MLFSDKEFNQPGISTCPVPFYPMPSFDNIPESHLQGRLILYFSKWFNVDFEVRSLCGTKRIDIVMYHNTDKFRQFPIGIEIKKTNIKRGSDIGQWCNQASEYTKLYFHEKRCYIFIVPQISGWYINEGERVKQHDVHAHGYLGAHNNINSFLYKSFGFGEIQKYLGRAENHLRLVMNTNLIWQSEYPFDLNTDKLQSL